MHRGQNLSHALTVALRADTPVPKASKTHFSGTSQILGKISHQLLIGSESQNLCTILSKIWHSSANS